MRTCLAAFLMTAMAATAAADDWEVTKSQEGNFKAELPGEATYSSQDQPTDAGTVQLHMYVYESEEGDTAYIAMYTDFPKGLSDAADPNALLDGAREGAVGSVGGQLVKEEKVKFGKYPSRILTIEGEQDGTEMVIRQRLILVGNRLYQQIVASSKEDPAPEEDVRKFYKSFELLRK